MFSEQHFECLQSKQRVSVGKAVQLAILQIWSATRCLDSEPQTWSLMPHAVCCSNCRTKYTLLTREDGCSNCALSFCKKCVSHRAVIPNLANRPVSVCFDCYQKLEKKANQQENHQISSQPLAPPPYSASRATGPAPSNWWGEGLPPPSMRQTIGVQPVRPPRRIIAPTRDNGGSGGNRERDEPTTSHEEIGQLEARAAELKKGDAADRIPSIEEIEERLAALRGCDVELIRNPRMWFASSSKEPRPADTVNGLMEQAKEQAELEEKYDPDRLLLERVDRLKDDVIPEETKTEKESGETGGSNEEGLRPFPSTASGLSEISSVSTQNTATKAEFEEYNRLIEDAKHRVETAPNVDDKQMQKEMREVMAATRQKSLDIEKVNAKFTTFWDRQIDKTEVSDSDSLDDSVDDETLRRIIAEAESAPDLPEPTSNSQPSKPDTQPIQSPKKDSIFNRLFKK